MISTYKSNPVDLMHKQNVGNINCGVVLILVNFTKNDTPLREDFQAFCHCKSMRWFTCVAKTGKGLTLFESNI